MAALRSELSKLFRMRITWASFGVVLLLVGLITWGSHHQQDHLDLDREFGSQFIVAGKTVTALFIANVALQVALVVLVPLLIAVVVGGLIAGERQTGSLRMLLSRPVARRKVLIAKLAASWAYAVSVTLFIGLCGLGLGQLVFGWGDLVVLRGGLTIFDPQTGLLRMAYAYGLGCLAMCSVAAVTLLLSAIVNNPMTAAGLSVASLLVSGIVAEMPYFENIKPHLLTSHLDVHREVLVVNIERADVVSSVTYLAGYLVVGAIIALIVFERRDVTC